MSRTRTRFSILLGILAWALPAASARAIEAEVAQEDPFEILPPAEQYYLIDDTQEHPAAVAMGHEISRELGGHWTVLRWNQYSDTPRKVVGSGIELVPGGLHSEAQVEQAARDFIASHAHVFGIDERDLATYRITHALGKWAIQFQQTVRGYPVEDAYGHLVFTDAGRLYAFGSNFYHDVSIPMVPLLGRESAVALARAAVPFDEDSEMTPINADRTVVLPMLVEVGDERLMTFRLAHRTEVPTNEPYGLYATYVDAASGDVLRRENQVENLYSGTTQGDVEIPSYCAGNTPNTPFTHMNVAITGVGTAVTDAAGNFSIAGSAGTQTYTAQFDGPFVNVNCSGCGSDATATGPIDADTPAAIYFPSGTYRADERDCFYFINKTRDYVTSIDPAWTYAKVTANVNVNATCNANWGGTILNFFRSGGGCHNTGEIGDVMAHEFGHCFQSSLLGGSQGPNGMGEGNADISGTFIIDGPVIGIGFHEGNCVDGLSCPGGSAACRTCENTLVYPGNVIGQPIHSAGRVICGFNWDTRQALEAKYGAAAGKLKTAQLWHFSRKMFGNPGYDQPDQVHDYFVMNDNDGNLDNGTPDHAEICGAATAHGFSCPAIVTGVLIAHTPLGNATSTTTPYDVVATITSTAGALDPDSLIVRYRLDGAGAYTSVQMTATGNTDEYHGLIPAQPCGTDVDYFIVAEDVLGNRATSPASAPASTYTFFVGNTLVYAQTFEAASDWTQDPSHTATTGAFVRIDPNAAAYQPGDDASPPPGVFGWITGQNTSDGIDDVDNGVSATRSPVLDLSPFTSARLSMKYFHGQRDPGGDPAGDFFRISLSNDGGASYPVNLVATGDVTSAPTWKSLDVDVETVIALTNQMRIRVQAADGVASGDLVEGGVDEVYILACQPPADTLPPVVQVTSPNGGETIVMGSNYDITWTATDESGVTGVDLLYSHDGGANYNQTLAMNEPNDGSFSWTLTQSATPAARIKIVAHDPGFLSAEDASDANFTIGPPPSAAPEMTFLGPNGGEVIDATTTALITWSASDDIAVTGVNLELSLDGGATFPIVIATNEPNDGAYTWSVEDVATTQARIRATAKDANFQTDSEMSDADFTIVLGVTGVSGPASVPDRVFLSPSVPEPFRDQALVRFGLPRSTSVDLAVYSVEGRIVRRLASGSMPAGTWERAWNGTDESGDRVPSGLYFLKLATQEGTFTQRITFVR
jgi:Zn-dependent metalloprotease